MQSVGVAPSRRVSERTCESGSRDTAYRSRHGGTDVGRRSYSQLVLCGSENALPLFKAKSQNQEKSRPQKDEFGSIAIGPP